MAKNNSSRTLVNLLGIPSLLAIIYLGDSFSNIPIFSAFIGGVLFLGAKEISPISKSKKRAAGYFSSFSIFSPIANWQNARNTLGDSHLHIIDRHCFNCNDCRDISKERNAST